MLASDARSAQKPARSHGVPRRRRRDTARSASTGSPALLSVVVTDLGRWLHENQVRATYGCPEPLEGLVSGTLLRPGPDCPTP